MFYILNIVSNNNGDRNSSSNIKYNQPIINIINPTWIQNNMNTTTQILHIVVAQENLWENLNGVNYNLPAKYAVDQNFEHLTLLCNGIHPYHISSPREAPQAIVESVMVVNNI